MRNWLVRCISFVYICKKSSIFAFSPCNSKTSCRQRISLAIFSTLNNNNEDDVTPSTVFTASPITITSSTKIPKQQQQQQQSDESTKVTFATADKVNSATLQFNNKLNQMSKQFDAVTAPKVESLLLEAVKDYKECNDEYKKGQMITPNTVSFTNAITAWARCTRKDSAKRAQSLLDQMHTLYKDEGWMHVRPNKISYNSVITAWARSRERGSSLQAEQLLRDMYEFYNDERGDGCQGQCEDLKPDSRSWNAVINAVARSRDEDCADRAK